MLLKEWFGGWAETIWNLSSKTRNPRPQNPESNVHIKSNIKNKNPKIQPQTSNIQLHGLSWTTSGWDTSKVSLPCSHISSSAPGSPAESGEAAIVYEPKLAWKKKVFWHRPAPTPFIPLLLPSPCSHWREMKTLNCCQSSNAITEMILVKLETILPKIAVEKKIPNKTF